MIMIMIIIMMIIIIGGNAISGMQYNIVYCCVRHTIEIINNLVNLV